MTCHVLLLFSFPSNLKTLSDQFGSGDVDQNLIPGFNLSNPSAVSAESYNAWFSQHGSHFPGNLTKCDLEEELKKVSRVNLNRVSVCFSGALCLTADHVACRVPRAQAWLSSPSQRPCHSCPAAPSGQRCSSSCCSTSDSAPCLAPWRASSPRSRTASRLWPTTRPKSQVNTCSTTEPAKRFNTHSFLVSSLL